MQDGLYINGVWVSEATGLLLTLQGNDLQKPDTLQSSFTRSYTLPDAIAVRELTQSAQAPNSASRAPYQLLPATLVQDGETFFRGVARLTSFSGGWLVELFESKRYLFERLDRSIRTAKLDKYNFTWNLDYISLQANSRNGIVFPLIDYGLLRNGQQPTDSMFPAMYVHTLVDELLTEEGYRLTGSLRSDELYNRLIIPFTEEQPNSRDDDWIEARKARVTEDPARTQAYIGGSSVLLSPAAAIRFPAWIIDKKAELVYANPFLKTPFDFVLKFGIVDQPQRGYTQGSQQNYKPELYSYVADAPMRLIVEATQNFQVSIDAGSVEAWLFAEKNGQPVASEYWTEGGPYNMTGAAIEQLQLKTTLELQPGDQVRFRFRLQRRSTVASFIAFVLHDENTYNFANFVPDKTTAFGDAWQVSRNLPDITALSLLKAIAFIFSGTYSVNELRKQVEFISFSEITQNLPVAANWSERIDESGEPTYTPSLEPYARKNRLKWKPADGVEAGYGDGLISCPYDTLAETVDLFELPFSATMVSTNSVTTYGEPPKIETRTFTTAPDGTTTITKKAASPRILLAYPETAITVPTKKLNLTGEPVDASAFLMPCWFDKRMGAASINPAVNYTLNFEGYNGLIARYYTGLKRVLRRPRQLSLSMQLTVADLSNLDLTRPVRLKQVRVGSIYIEDSFWYINRISNYRFGRGVCTVEMVAIS